MLTGEDTMHQDFLLVATHYGANLNPFIRGLVANSEISLNLSPLVYTNSMDLHSLITACNQLKKSRVVSDFVLHNHSIQCTDLSNICFFLYYLHEPRDSMTRLIQEYGYPPQKALDHYAFRLQRLAAMAKNTPKSFLLTYDTLDDLHSKALSKSLHLKNPIYFSIEADDKCVPAQGAIADKAERIYQKYLTQMMKSREQFSEVGSRL
jgi:hypothetical protein